MTIDELESGLPNGLHDAYLRAFSSDPAAGQAAFTLDLWIGNLHSSLAAERECRRPARLELLGVTYLVIDPPDPRYPVADDAPVQIDSCAADDDPERSRLVPEGGFAGRFFVTEWNAFIHFAALDARLTWTGAN